ncbi:MAG: CRISPR-associated endoribonuclease Cas6 [Candidatus Methanospirareceae archaeon]
MRLLVTFRAAKDQGYERMYHHKLQGFVYGLLRDAGWNMVHEKEGYKFFCFSNIFPIADMEKGDVVQLLLASPSAALLTAIERALQGAAQERGVLHIGELSFELIALKELVVKLSTNGLRVLTATPVIIRIPERNYERYGIPEAERKARYVYWRPKYPFEAFLKQLSENLMKKYTEFHKVELENHDLFEQFVFRRPTATKVIIDGKEYEMVGSMWEFMWSYLDDVQRQVLEFGLDAGFGERSSLGFGFVNRKGLQGRDDT